MAVPKKRTTKAQFGIYLNYLSSHEIFRTQKMTPNCGPEIVDALWEELQGSLNSCGDGPLRTVQEWKKVFTEWKSATRKKARENKDLNDLEKKLIDLTGKVAVQGICGVKEVGLEVHQTGPAICDIPNKDCVEKENPLDKLESSERSQSEEEENEDQRRSQDLRKTKKRIRKSTTDVLTNAYEKASHDQKDGLNNISKALENIAKAIHRYCDIVERKTND